MYIEKVLFLCDVYSFALMRISKPIINHRGELMKTQGNDSGFIVCLFFIGWGRADGKRERESPAGSMLSMSPSSAGSQDTELMN